MAKHDIQNVSYMRKDSHFLADGIWYVSTPCPIHGLVDEEIPWEDAKTPHHAGLIADQRHVPCNEQASAETVRKAALAEIDAAAGQLEQQKLNLADAQRKVEETKARPFNEHETAKANLKKHEEGLIHAQRRLEYIRATNTPS